MFKFAEPTYLYLLLLVPILIGIHLYSLFRRKRNFKKLGNPDLLKLLMPNVSRFRPKIKFQLQLLALILIIVVLAQPQFGSEEKLVKKTGINVMIALDVSNSMWCEDIKPSRIEKAKLIASQLIDKMENDRIGLVVFAAYPFIQHPITTDLVSAKMFLSTISPTMLAPQGTAIGAALKLCARSFDDKSDESRVIILITDGENHEDNAVDVAESIAKNGIQTYVIGIGTPQGAPIPLPETTNFLKDKQGNVVVTKLDEKHCRDIAAAGQGIYVLADNGNYALRTINENLNKLSKTEYETSVFVDHNEQFQSFAFLALFLVILEFFILYRRNKRLARMKFFDLEKSEKKIS